MTVDYDDLKTGDKIPSLTIKESRVQLVMYCAVTWDFYRYHYDSELVQRFGLPKPVVDPQMHSGFMARMLTDWVSESGRIRKLSLRYRAPCFVGDTITYRGRVTDKYVKDGEKYVDCELTVENQKGEHTVNGTASILFY